MLLPVRLVLWREVTSIGHMTSPTQRRGQRVHFALEGLVLLVIAIQCAFQKQWLWKTFFSFLRERARPCQKGEGVFRKCFFFFLFLGQMCYHSYIVNSRLTWLKLSVSAKQDCTAEFIRIESPTPPQGQPSDRILAFRCFITQSVWNPWPRCLCILSLCYWWKEYLPLLKDPSGAQSFSFGGPKLTLNSEPMGQKLLYYTVKIEKWYHTEALRGKREKILVLHFLSVIKTFLLCLWLKYKWKMPG